MDDGRLAVSLNRLKPLGQEGEVENLGGRCKLSGE